MKKTTEELIIDNMDYLHHFIECEGYPVQIDKKRAKQICKDIDAFALNKVGLLIKKESIPFSNELLIAYWKNAYNEQKESYEQLYDSIKRIADNF